MTTPQFWLGLALGVPVVALALALALRQRPGARSQDEGALPLTHLQTRAIAGLVIGALTAIVVIALVATSGPGAFLTEDGTRERVYAVFAIGLLAYGAMSLAIGWVHRGETRLDERDREILARAPRLQAAAILFGLLVWSIALTEVYWERGSVPISFPFLIFLSSALLGLLGFSTGILVGYRRA